MAYEAVIGLEVHAQLKTQSKIFCRCKTDFGASPNSQTCPVCLGHPGVLPVLNKDVVLKTVITGLALDFEVQKESIWARKNYFYPDLPKGYQISQYEKPICLAGKLAIQVEDQKKTINITRIHMEEDAGKLTHDKGEDSISHVDLNRAGVPLMEIVSEPDMRSAKEAGEYLRTLRQVLRYLDVCDGNMEEGSLRCDANVSIRKFGEEKLGTKVEVKNINSFRFVEKAIEYEIERQSHALNTGQEIVQETRLFDNQKMVTKSMRSKEEAHDYRYFPDPDLPKLILDDALIQKAKDQIPELPHQRATRFENDFKLSNYDALIITSEKESADFYENAVKAYPKQPKLIANWFTTELLGEMNKAKLSLSTLPFKPSDLAKLVELIDNQTISGKIAKTVLLEMFGSGKTPETIVKEKGLVQVSDEGALVKVIEETIAENPNQYEQYKQGKDKLFGFFVGQVMKKTKGQANPQLVNELLKKKL